MALSVLVRWSHVDAVAQAEDSTARGGETMRSYILPAIVVLIGVLFLLVNMGILPSLGVRELLGEARESIGGRWWPVILIALGAWLFVRRSRA